MQRARKPATETSEVRRARDANRCSVRKAVFPVAGLGTRFLPATKCAPKEILPVVDKPLVQYAVEEAVAAGITEIIFITSRQKRAIEDHFDHAHELETALRRDGKAALLNPMRPLMPPHVRYAYVRQHEQLGLGHAVLCARPLVGDEPFAVILPDDLMDADTPVLSQMLAQHAETGASVIAVEEVPPQDVEKYGVVATEMGAARAAPISGIVEKPRSAEAPSNLAVVGRYVLTPRIFEHLCCTGPGRNGEIQLTDAIALLARDEPVFAYRFEGERFDCGSKIGFLAATLHFGLKHPEVGESFARLLRRHRTAPPVSTNSASAQPGKLASVGGAAMLGP